MFKKPLMIQIPENEIGFDCTCASGPGGQNVNKITSAVQLRLNFRNSSSLPQDAKDRLIRFAAQKVKNKGVLVLEAKRHRTQKQNRMDARNRLIALIQKALLVPKTRKPTRPTLNAQAARRLEKQHRSQIKRWRRYNSDD